MKTRLCPDQMGASSFITFDLPNTQKAMVSEPLSRLTESKAGNKKSLEPLRFQGNSW